MDERKLVTSRKITDILPIEGADKIEVAVVDGWKVVVKKGEFYKGQVIFYFEVDSMLPLDRGYFSFLRERGVKVRNGKEYHRLRTVKLRGQVSQGLILPWNIFQINPQAVFDQEQDAPVSVNKDGERISPYLDPDICTDRELEIYDNGGNFTDYFGVIKYEPPMPEELRGKCFNWPDFIKKTDEERLQNLPGLIESLDPKDWYATEKIDGTSTTLFMTSDLDEEGNYKKGVCSRNYELVENDDNLYWRIAKESSLFDIMKTWMDHNKVEGQTTILALQGETFGPGIQGNPLGVKEQRILLYTIQVNGERLSRSQIWEDQDLHRLTSEDYWVPIHSHLSLATNMNEMIAMTDGIKTLVPGANKDAQIEGLVWRCFNSSEIKYKKNVIKASFKCISNKYLLKHDG